MIEENLLLKYNASLKNYSKNNFLFRKNDIARSFFQIYEGEVKVFNTSSEGKEFIQSIFSKNRGIGEPALLGDFNYPSSCITTNNSRIWVMSKANFFKLLTENPDIHFKISKNISARLYYKTLMSAQISIENPELRILTLLNYLKNTIYKKSKKYDYKVELSRQEIGDLTGLRVETVIRTIKKLEIDNHLKLINHKIYI